MALVSFLIMVPHWLLSWETGQLLLQASHFGQRSHCSSLPAGEWGLDLHGDTHIRLPLPQPPETHALSCYFAKPDKRYPGWLLWVSLRGQSAQWVLVDACWVPIPCPSFLPESQTHGSTRFIRNKHLKHLHNLNSDIRYGNNCNKTQEWNAGTTSISEHTHTTENMSWYMSLRPIVCEAIHTNSNKLGKIFSKTYMIKGKSRKCAFKWTLIFICQGMTVALAKGTYHMAVLFCLSKRRRLPESWCWKFNFYFPPWRKK